MHLTQGFFRLIFESSPLINQAVSLVLLYYIKNLNYMQVRKAVA